ncbi:hypothetical protein CHU92_13325 [Flavobacterium cyanobacteriorum]|uniref:Phosphoribosylpyrophosphate synthetase n=2 Tax=Flavobacterium cyanobacteriorum TaxID=2022802 RepID=A0A255YV80_9FLAO|nr:hypothetical protein CHU92_13325 [Flavobacterium cyanobacteriorum]
MEIQYHYATVSKAIEELRQKGYNEDFNLDNNYLVCHSGRFGHEEFVITDIYFYEGETDPGDEATVYGILSASGHKGVLVTGDEADLDPMSGAIIDKLLVHRNNR